MSIYSVKQYQSEVEKLIHRSHSRNETTIRPLFANLLNEYAKAKGLTLVQEFPLRGNKKRPDGTLKDNFVTWGYWESKDEADDIDKEIEKKFKIGYPKNNILFEDKITAVLIQGGTEVMRVPMSDAEKLDRIIKEFVSYEPLEIQDFHKAIELFKQDIPDVTNVLRSMVIEQEITNLNSRKLKISSGDYCIASINPEISQDDIREMIIQHILTKDIFNTILAKHNFTVRIILHTNLKM